jgi:hypothetical protein
MHINVETFDALMRKSGMTLAELSRKSKVGTKTIGRIRKSEDLRKSNVEKIVAVFGVDIATLINPPSAALIAGAEKKSGNMQRMVVDLPPAALNRIWMTAHYYNVSARALLEFAPLFFSIVAETSLNQRRKKMENLWASLEEMMKEAPAQYEDEIDDVKSGMRNLYWAEMDSIKERDLTGGVTVRYWAEKPGGNDDENTQVHSFFNTIEEMASSTDFYVDFKDSNLEDIWYDIYADEPLDAIFPSVSSQSSSERQSLIELALKNGDILIRDIPIELMSKNKTEERVRWLENAYEMVAESIEERTAAHIAELQDKEPSDA